jgi:hypothetical protein
LGFEEFFWKFGGRGEEIILDFFKDFEVLEWMFERILNINKYRV